MDNCVCNLLRMDEYSVRSIRTWRTFRSYTITYLTPSVCFTGTRIQPIRCPFHFRTQNINMLSAQDGCLESYAGHMNINQIDIPWRCYDLVDFAVILRTVRRSVLLSGILGSLAEQEYDSPVVGFEPRRRPSYMALIHSGVALFSEGHV